MNLIEKRKKVVGNYIFGRSIGEGTFGRVQIAIHSPSKESVAIKILEKSKIKDQNDIKRINLEIKILKNSLHKNIIQLYEVMETANKIYLVMECASYGEMFDYIVKHKYIKEREACIFFHQIIDGIDFLHKNFITHRDLKPENLLLKECKYGLIVKIVDFGLSSFHEGNRLLSTACGSPCYASPEMISGMKYEGPLSDLWSVGVILFALVCGYLPFEDKNTTNLYKKILAGSYNAAAWLSKDVKHLLRGILETDPKKRYRVADIRNDAWYCQVADDDVPREYLSKPDREKISTQALLAVSQLGLSPDEVIRDVAKHNCNSSTATYFLFEQKYRNQRLNSIFRAPVDESSSSSSKKSITASNGVNNTNQVSSKPTTPKTRPGTPRNSPRPVPSQIPSQQPRARPGTPITVSLGKVDMDIIRPKVPVAAPTSQRYKRGIRNFKSNQPPPPTGAATTAEPKISRRKSPEQSNPSHNGNSRKVDVQVIPITHKPVEIDNYVPEPIFVPTLIPSPPPQVSQPPVVTDSELIANHVPSPPTESNISNIRQSRIEELMLLDQQLPVSAWTDDLPDSAPLSLEKEEDDTPQPLKAVEVNLVNNSTVSINSEAPTIVHNPISLSAAARPVSLGNNGVRPGHRKMIEVGSFSKLLQINGIQPKPPPQPANKPPVKRFRNNIFRNQKEKLIPSSRGSNTPRSDPYKPVLVPEVVTIVKDSSHTETVITTAMEKPLSQAPLADQLIEMIHVNSAPSGIQEVAEYEYSVPNNTDAATTEAIVKETNALIEHSEAAVDAVNEIVSIPSPTDEISIGQESSGDINLATDAIAAHGEVTIDEAIENDPPTIDPHELSAVTEIDKSSPEHFPISEVVLLTDKKDPFEVEIVTESSTEDSPPKELVRGCETTEYDSRVDCNEETSFMSIDSIIPRSSSETKFTSIVPSNELVISNIPMIDTNPEAATVTSPSPVSTEPMSSPDDDRDSPMETSLLSMDSIVAITSPTANSQPIQLATEVNVEKLPAVNEIESSIQCDISRNSSISKSYIDGIDVDYINSIKQSMENLSVVQPPSVVETENVPKYPGIFSFHLKLLKQKKESFLPQIRNKQCESVSTVAKEQGDAFHPILLPGVSSSSVISVHEMKDSSIDAKPQSIVSEIELAREFAREVVPPPPPLQSDVIIHHIAVRALEPLVESPSPSPQVHVPDKPMENPRSGGRRGRHIVSPQANMKTVSDGEANTTSESSGSV